MRKSRDKFGRSFTKFQLSCHEEVDAAFSDDEIEEELVDGFTNYRIVCDAECNCSQENVFGIDVATVMITHDESTFYSNECKQIVWMENG